MTNNTYTIFEQLSGAQLWHYENEVFVIKKVSFAPHSYEGFPLHLVINLFCTSGYVRGRVDQQEFTITPGTRLVMLSGKVVEVEEVSPDFDATIIGLSSEFVEDLKIENAYALYDRLRRTMVQPMTNRESVMLNDFINLLIATINTPRNPHKREALKTLIRGFHYAHTWYDRETSTEAPNYQSDRNDAMMLRFTELLEANYKNEHRLEYYAGLLRVTPKYLSSCVARASGHTAGWWVDYYIMRDAEELLRNTTLSVKEIANHLGFEDPSDFGKYFKRQKGNSPSEYRKVL